MNKLKLWGEFGIFLRGWAKRNIEAYCLANDLNLTIREHTGLLSSMLVFEIEGDDRAALEHLYRWFETLIKTHGVESGDNETRR